MSIDRRLYGGYHHRSYSFMPDGQSFISGGLGGELAAFDLTGRQARQFRRPRERRMVRDAVARRPPDRLWQPRPDHPPLELKTFELIVTLFRHRRRVGDVDAARLLHVLAERRPHRRLADQQGARRRPSTSPPASSATPSTVPTSSSAPSTAAAPTRRSSRRRRARQLQALRPRQASAAQAAVRRPADGQRDHARPRRHHARPRRDQRRPGQGLRRVRQRREGQRRCQTPGR